MINVEQVNEIIQFINRFTSDGRCTDIVECFSNGHCYWFAYILNKRFNSVFPSSIVHDSINNHFACSINGRIYDITGDITEQNHEWDLWETIPN